MNRAAPEKMLQDWDLEANQTPIGKSTLPHRFELQCLRLLAQGDPVTAEMIAGQVGIPTRLAEAVFEASRGKGQWDEAGRLMGSALTLVPTAHRFRVSGKDLYTWCAYDTLLLPGLLGVAAEIQSPDPRNGTLIRLVVGPDGPETYSPGSAVLTTYQAAEPATGPESPMCTNSHYFTSAGSAEAWSRDRVGVTVTTIEEAFAQIKRHLLDPLKPILDELD